MPNPATKPERANVAPAPALAREVTFHTDFAQRVYNRIFDHLKADIFTLTVRSRTLDGEQVAQAAEKFIQEQFEKARQDLTSEMQRLDVLLERCNITEMPSYRRALQVRAEYTSPQANEFLKLIELMDQVVRRLDAAWLNAEVETKRRTLAAYDWQRRMMHIGNRVRDLGGRGRKAMLQQLQSRRTRRTQSLEGTASGSDVAPTAESPDHETLPSTAPEITSLEVAEEQLDALIEEEQDTKSDQEGDLTQTSTAWKANGEARKTPPKVLEGG